MCASAGIPFVPEIGPGSEDGDYMEISERDSILDYQNLLPAEDNDAMEFMENEEWPVVSSRFPLKERYLQLLCGSEDSETEQYYNVIDHWAPDDDGSLDVDMLVKEMQVMPPRKRAFELLHRECSSESDMSRPVTEEVRSKRRWDGQWGRFAVVGGGGDGGSE